MTGAKYADLVLKDKLKICAEQFTEVTGKIPVVIEDNAPCHRAKIADEARQAYVSPLLVSCFMNLSLAVFQPTFLRDQHSLQT